MAVVTKNQSNKTRSKGAKIVLWSLLGCVAANVLVLIVMLIIAACGGTGTSYGGILGSPFNTAVTVLAVLAGVLIMAYMLTEPSFKKTEPEEVNHDLDYRTQYVRKAANPHPMAAKAAPVEAKPAEESAPVEEKAE